MGYYFLQKYILHVSSVVKTIFPLEFMVTRKYQISTTIPCEVSEKQGHSNLTIIHAEENITFSTLAL